MIDVRSVTDTNPAPATQTPNQIHLYSISLSLWGKKVTLLTGRRLKKRHEGTKKGRCFLFQPLWRLSSVGTPQLKHMESSQSESSCAGEKQ